MKLEPLYDRVALKKSDKKENKIGNILLPEISGAPDIWEVVKLGRGKLENKVIDFEVKVGDKVILNKNAGFTCNLSNKTYLIIKESEILAIVN